MKKIVILGVTGSIGTQALQVIESSEELRLMGASCRDSVEALSEIMMRHGLEEVSVESEDARDRLIAVLKEKEAWNDSMRIHTGKEGLVTLATMEEADLILTSVVGLSGLIPTVEAIKAGKDIALANKETLVGAGEIVMGLAREKGVRILPVDSEHSAIFQSMQGYTNEDIRRIILTASGGPFRGRTREELKGVTLDEALAHPNWNMGKKVTVDSATLMNKGLEAIEAHWLFDVGPDDIDVHVHPQSILHSAVEFKDNSVIGQMGTADMRLPIQYALNYPERICPVVDRLDLFSVGRLDFLRPDMEAFGCLALAFKAMRLGGFYPLVLNTADEIAVELFLEGRIGFLDIERIVGEAMERYGEPELPFTLDNIMALDGIIRKELMENYRNQEIGR